MTDETTQGTHPLTVEWWRSLPGAFRRADRVQGFRLRDAWKGLNADPRFITGWDSWYRTNTSTNAWEVSVAFTRTFHATPNIPVHIHSWHHPTIVAEDGTRIPFLDGTRIRHVVRNYTGTVIADEGPVLGADLSRAVILDGGSIIMGAEDIADGGTVTTAAADETIVQTVEMIHHHTLVTPDRFGTLQVTVEVTLDVTDPDLPTHTDYLQRLDYVPLGPRNLLDAIHVGHTDPQFEELPGLDYFSTAGPYPLLRFMDGIGHQAGYLSDQANRMHDGAWVDPYEAPEANLAMLAAVLGVPKRYMDKLTLPELRQHLVDLVAGNTPTPGSRDHIAVTAQMWLTGTKQCSVIPAHAWPGYLTPAEKDLIDAMGYNGRAKRVLVSTTPPTPAVWHQWAAARHGSVSVLYRNGTRAAENRILNPRFATSVSNWGVNSTATLTHDTTFYETGGATAKITPTGADWYFLETYKTAITTSASTMRWRVFSPVARRVRLYVWRYDGDESQAGPVVTLPAGVWTTLSMDFTTTTDRRYRPSIRPTDDIMDPLWIDRVYEAREGQITDSYFDGDSPDSSANDIWIEKGTGAVYTWNTDPNIDDANVAEWVNFTTPDVSVQSQAVLTERFYGDPDRLHTLVVLVRSDELPVGYTLDQFTDFLNASGAIPAGHRVVPMEFNKTWDQYETSMGENWATHDAASPTWNAHQSAGVSLEYTEGA